MTRKTRFLFALFFASLLALIPASALAENSASASSNNRYVYDVTVNAGGKGYSNAERMKVDDPHYGWSLGRFEMTGFTSRIDGETPVFLKNVGDQLTLTFVLDQDIDALNGNEDVVIHRDEDGYDEYFGIERQDFGRGTLIVRHIDYQNASAAPVVYTNYLEGSEAGAEIAVDVFEEGDYEVSLDYEVESPWVLSFVPFAHNYTNYRILFRFKVRNSNTMAFLIDSATGSELFDGMATPNGFRVDLANSHYLEVNVQRKVMNDTEDGIVEDTRFNRSATDGSTFTDEGIYVVTVKNPTTGEQTTKTIYVGDNDILKASVTNQMDVADVEEQLAQGASIAEDGTILPPATNPIEPVEIPEDIPEDNQNDKAATEESDSASPETEEGSADAPAAWSVDEPEQPTEHSGEADQAGEVGAPIIPIGIAAVGAAIVGFGLKARKRGAE